MKRLAVIASASLLAASLAPVASATESATATLTPSGAGPYHYSVSLHDTGTTTVGTLWYAWIPGYDFLPSAPTNIVSPTGWTGMVTSEYGGYGVEWYANTSASYLAAGGTLTGFGFNTPDSPTTLSMDASGYPYGPINTSYVYSGTPLGDAGASFVATIGPAPEPASLAALGLGALGLLRRRRR